MNSDDTFWKNDLYPSEAFLGAVGRHSAGRSSAGMQTDDFDVAAARRALGDTDFEVPESVAINHIEVAGVPCIEVLPEGLNDDFTIVYLHGGGYCAGSWDSHKGHATSIAMACGKKTVFVEYRRAPEHAYPAALDDCYAVVAALSASPLALAGDSAGAGLCVAITRRLLDAGSSGPLGLALMCGMFDLNPDTADYLIKYGRARVMASLYVADADPRDPSISPVFADFSRFPPTLIQMGGADYIKDDSIRLANKAMSDGAPIVLEHWPEMSHVWQRFVPDVPEARNAISRVAQFLLGCS